MLAVTGGSPVRTKPFPGWPVRDAKDEEAVAQVVREGVWGIGGRRIAEFESSYAAFHDAKHGIAVANGTVALQVALTALGVGPGDEVIVPAYTFAATGAAVMHVGAIPVIVDIDPDTLLLDPEATEAAITESTKGIIPVHVGGQPANLDRFVDIAKKHNLFLLEDAAQAHGAKWNGRGVGSFGDLGTFSFQATKNLASGEGGIIITNDDRLAAYCRAYADCGRFGAETNFPPVLGWNYRITELQAALLLSQMERLPAQIDKREENARYLTERLSGIPGIELLKRDSRITVHAHHLFCFKVKQETWGLDLNRFIAGLNAEGIPCSSGYRPLYRDPMFVTHGPSTPSSWPGLPNQWEKRDYAKMFLPHVEQASNETVWLFQSTFLGTKEDMDDIATAIKKLWDHREQLAAASISGSPLRYAGLGD